MGFTWYEWHVTPGLEKQSIDPSHTIRISDLGDVVLVPKPVQRAGWPSFQMLQ